MRKRPATTRGLSESSTVSNQYSAYGGPWLPTLGRILVGRLACALNRTEYTWPFWMVISRWRSCASQRLTPGFFTSRHSSPSTTADLPPAGVVNELIQGRLLPPSKVPFLSRLFGSVLVSTGASAAGGKRHPHTSSVTAILI